MRRLDEPDGWRLLKSMAERASDSHTLAVIIDAMNRLLDEHQTRVADDGLKRVVPALNVELEARQYD
jgi:hypothetical protein